MNKKLSVAVFLLLFLILWNHPFAEVSDPLLRTACLLISEGKIDEAVNLLEKDIEHRPWNHNIRFYLGICHYKKNEKELAEKNLKEIWKELDKMVGDTRTFGDESMFLSMGMARKERGFFSEENKGLFYFVYGLILKEKGNFKEAEKNLTEAVKAGYPEIQTRYQLLDLALKQKKLKDAQKEFEKISRITAENEDLLLVKSYLLEKSGKFQEAKACLEKILFRDQKNLAARKNLGIIAYNMSKYQDALDIWEKILTEKPDEQDVLINAGRACFHLGQKEKAQELFSKAGLEIPVESYSPKTISLTDPELDKKIDFKLPCN